MKVIRTIGVLCSLLIAVQVSCYAFMVDLMQQGDVINHNYSDTFNVDAYVKSIYGEESKLRIEQASMLFSFLPGELYTDDTVTSSYMDNGEWITEYVHTVIPRAQIAACTALGRTQLTDIRPDWEGWNKTMLTKTFTGWLTDTIPKYDVHSQLTAENFVLQSVEICFDESMINMLNTTGLLSYSIACGDPIIPNYPDIMHINSVIFSGNVSTVAPVPEPSSLLLLGMGLLGFLKIRNKKN